jgi:tetratricopeptide (TPR) repeat protein
LDLGDLYASSDNFEDAEPMFTEALKISKKLAETNPEIYSFNVALIQSSLGTVYIRLKNYKKAEQMYLDSLKIFKIYAKQDPKTYSYNVADVRNNLGNVYMYLENLERAEHYLNKASKADPTNGDILFHMACLESLKNNPENALDFLEKAIKLDEKYIEWAKHDERIDSLRELEEYKELIGEQSEKK